MSKELIVMAGNIGTGKTTYVKNYQKEGYIVIARDTLRYAIGGGTYVFNLDYEPIVHATEKYLLRKFLDLGVNIVIDETNVTARSRRVLDVEAKQGGYKVICIVMPRLSKKDSVDRRMQNPHDCPDRTVWEGVWGRFNDKYEEPKYSEGFDEINFITDWA